MGLFNWFSSPKPLPRFEIKDLNGNVIFVAPWSDLYSRNLSDVVLHNVDLRNVRMEYCDCRGTDFTGSKFNNASMRGCDLRGAIVQYCDLSGADLSQAQVDGADFFDTEFGGKRNRCKFDDATGVQQAAFSPQELINGRFNDKHLLKFIKTKPVSKKDLARIPERPRCLLILGDPLGSYQRSEQSVVELNQVGAAVSVDRDLRSETRHVKNLPPWIPLINRNGRWLARASM
ncbi:MAG TPA: pentapeptide repeat-containing protein [Candidatus Acidoferrum sp.]|jgi:hypothetical protein